MRRSTLAGHIDRAGGVPILRESANAVYKGGEGISEEQRSQAMSGEQRLWIGVLAQAISDLIGREVDVRRLRGRPKSTKSYWKTRGRHQYQLKMWLGSRDFYEVCERAGMDGRAILDRLRRMPELRDPT